jgi:hypothetical protein
MFVEEETYYLVLNFKIKNLLHKTKTTINRDRIDK